MNAARLLDVCRATEEQWLDEFNMDWVCRTDLICGTVGCMIGNYNAMVGRHPGVFGWNVQDWIHFGITEAEYDWLFGPYAEIGKWTGKDRDLEEVTKEQALNRLRKFIHYKLRKQQKTEEYMRRQEGNHGFVTLAVQDASISLEVFLGEAV